MRSILRTLAIWSAVIFPAALSAQTSAPEHTIEWEITHEKIDGKDAVVFTGQIAEGWHTYDADSELYPFSVEFTDIKGCSVSGEPYALSESRDYSGEKVFFDEVRFAVGIELESPDASVSGEISWMSCTETTCAAPEFKTFSVDFGSGAAGATSGGKSEDGGNLWALIIEAILWGFAALLTPCVFPMVPMTVSFFLKGSSTPAAGRFKAAMYGLFIVLLYTVPISLIILITRIVGGDAVTADIFNWLATHWLPNTIFFIVFMIFAASFFGAFEIVLPTSLVNKSDKKRVLEKMNDEIEVSAKDKKNLQLLKESILQKTIGEDFNFNASVLANERQLEILKEALKQTKQAISEKSESIEILSLVIKKIWQTLGKITGKTENEDIIDLIFSRFCVGK